MRLLISILVICFAHLSSLPVYTNYLQVRDTLSAVSNSRDYSYDNSLEPDSNALNFKEPLPFFEEIQKGLVYPPKARELGLEGRVIVRALVNKKGKVSKCVVEFSDNDIFNEAAITAIKRSKYTPAIQEGKPIACWVSIPIQFKLRGEDE